MSSLDGKASVRVLKLGQTDGDYVQILSGLAAGDMVVVDGADRLREGAEVRVVADGRGGARKGGRAERAAQGAHPLTHAARRHAGGRVARERLGALHPAAGGDDAADGRDPAVGLLAYRFLPLAALPEVDYPTIQVQTFYPGASPEVMTSSVTAPLERQFGQMPGLNQMTSASSAGASVITLQFGLSLSLDVAEQEVQAAINAAEQPAARRPAGAADLRQGQSRRRADPDAWPSPRRRCR